MQVEKKLIKLDEREENVCDSILARYSTLINIKAFFYKRDYLVKSNFLVLINSLVLILFNY